MAGVLVFLAFEIGPPLVQVALLCLGSATRAIAPWLLPPLIGLVWASTAGVDLLAALVERRSPWLISAAELLGARTVMLLFVLARGSSRDGRCACWRALAPCLHAQAAF